MNLTNVLAKFEHLAAQAIFPTNKNEIIQFIGLNDVLLDATNHQVRTVFSNKNHPFADMSRVVR